MTGPKSDNKKSAEKQAEQYELDKMAKNLAHEINSPLSTIQLHAENIVEEIEAETAELDDLKDSAEIIMLSVERINKIIKAVRSYSGTNMKAPFLSANLSQLVAEAISELKPKLTAANVKVEFNQMEKNLTVKCRATEVSQILVNVIKNAAEAIEPQDEPWIKVEIKDNDPYMEVRIMDSGPGISDEMKKKIFQPLFSTKSRKTNMGVGLALCRRIAEVHGGTLDVDTGCENTCFVISLLKKPAGVFSTDEVA